MTTPDKETIYIKKFIKSEDDLPKEGSYICHFKEFPDNSSMGTIYTNHKCMNDCDWYLQEIQLPTDEEIVIAESISTYIIKPDASSFELLSQGFRDGVRWLISKLKGNG